MLSLGWLLLRLLGRFCRACRFRGSLISLPLVLASLTGCGVLLRLLLSFCLLGGWSLQRLGLLSASGVVALLRQVGAEVQIGILIFDLIHTDRHGVQRGRVAEIERSLLRDILEFLVAALLCIQNLADKAYFIGHIVFRAQHQQQPVLDHHLNVQRIADIVVGDVGETVCIELFINDLQSLQLLHQRLAAYLLSQIAACAVDKPRRQPNDARRRLRQCQHAGFQHLAGGREKGEAFKGVNRSQDLLLLNLHLQGCWKLPGYLDRTDVRQFAAQRFFRVRDIDTKEAFPFLGADFIDDLLLAVNTAAGHLDLIQFKKDGVAHHKDDGQAECRKQNVVEQILAQFAQLFALWRAARFYFRHSKTSFPSFSNSFYCQRGLKLLGSFPLLEGFVRA